MVQNVQIKGNLAIKPLKIYEKHIMKEWIKYMSYKTSSYTYVQVFIVAPLVNLDFSKRYGEKASLRIGIKKLREDNEEKEIEDKKWVLASKNSFI